MSNPKPSPKTRFAIAELATRKPNYFDYTMPQDRASALVDALGHYNLSLTGLRKLRIKGKIHAKNRSDWVLEAQVGATAIQSCAITLEPITTRIDNDIRRVYSDEIQPMSGGEEEMLMDADMDPLPEVIDLESLIEEELLLALPPFPRRDDAVIGEISSSPAGASAIDEVAEKPFAGLAALRDKLNKPE